LRCFQVALIIFILICTFYLTTIAQKSNEPFALEGGISLGMQEFQKVWIGTFGFLLEFGNPSGLQLRFALNSGLFNKLVLTQIETLFLINFGNPDKKFYAGAGLGVPMIIGELEGELPINVIVFGGVKSPISTILIAQIEGGIMIPTSGGDGITFRGALAGIFSF